jgi:subtilisin family serine protease
LPTDPTKSNLVEWSRAWDGESWVLGLRTRQVNENSLLKQFEGSLLTQWQSLATSSPVFKTFSGGVPRVLSAGELRSQMSLSLSPIPLAKCPNRSCPSFAFVKFSSQKLPWMQTFGLGFLEKSDMLHILGAGRFGFLQSTFQAMPDVAYAEPDLIAPLDPIFKSAQLIQKRSDPLSMPQSPGLALAPTSDANAPTAVDNRTYIEHLNNIKIIDAEKESNKKNFVPREIVVAVLDTGVDAGNKYLKDRMFTFPGKSTGDKPAVVSIEGNSYLADAHGIDASWSSKTAPEIQALSPGSTDVGGPGVACPTGADNQALPSESGTGCGHGTHVAGLVAASEFQSKENAPALGRGVCPACRILAVRVAETANKTPANNGRILDGFQIRGIQFVLGLKRTDGTLYTNVVNMSIGQYTSTRAMRSVIDGLEQSGIVIVAAASNHNTDRPSYPAAYQPVISVCATSSTKSRGRYVKASFSNFGQWVKICAPGENIESTYPGPIELNEIAGTSMASPIVAGAAGFLLSIADAIKVGELNRNEKVRNSLLVRSNWSALYAEPLNLPYQFELPDGSGVEFLGRGFLDVANAFLGNRDIDKERKSVPTDQIKGGCVVSAVAASSAQSLNLFFGSMPFTLGLFLLFLNKSRLVMRVSGFLKRSR